MCPQGQCPPPPRSPLAQASTHAVTAGGKPLDRHASGSATTFSRGILSSAGDTSGAAARDVEGRQGVSGVRLLEASMLAMLAML